MVNSARVQAASTCVRMDKRLTVQGRRPVASHDFSNKDAKENGMQSVVKQARKCILTADTKSFNIFSVTLFVCDDLLVNSAQQKQPLTEVNG